MYLVVPESGAIQTAVSKADTTTALHVRAIVAWVKFMQTLIV